MPHSICRCFPVCGIGCSPISWRRRALPRAVCVPPTHLLDLLKGFGIEVRNAVPRLDLSDETKRRAEKILADEGIAAAS
ncbi:MAG: hypothetical protein MZV70_48765 [Desulfobacterales bacterium]|nr:hypothetical protein [Desulfobacterales bacterium]